jgi:hypothetical protein
MTGEAEGDRVKLIRHDVLLEQHSEEIEKMRTFKHEMNNFVQKLAGDLDGLIQDMRVVVGLSERVAAVEKEQASHTAVCNERYSKIAEYMAQSREDRQAIKNAQDDMKTSVGRGIIGLLLTLLGATCLIIGAFIWRFGLPPMGN